MALGGKDLGSLYEEEKKYPIVLRLKESERSNINLIKQLPIGINEYLTVPLSSASNISFAETFGSITRENAKRRIIVSANSSGQNLEDAHFSILKVTEKMQLPTGFFIHRDCQYLSQVEGTKKLIYLGIISLIGIFVVLFMHFHSASIALQIMLNIPLALM